jgi:hypothetical protein
MTVHLALIAALAPLSFALYRYTPTDLARGPIRRRPWRCVVWNQW